MGSPQPQGAISQEGQSGAPLTRLQEPFSPNPSETVLQQQLRLPHGTQYFVIPERAGSPSLLASRCRVTFIGDHCACLCLPDPAAPAASLPAHSPVLAGRQLCSLAPCKMSSASRAEQASKEPLSRHPSKNLFLLGFSSVLQAALGWVAAPSPAAHQTPSTPTSSWHPAPGPSPQLEAGLPFPGSPLPGRCVFIPRPGSQERNKPRSEQRPGPIPMAQLRRLKEQLALKRCLCPVKDTHLSCVCQLKIKHPAPLMRKYLLWEKKKVLCTVLGRETM